MTNPREELFSGALEALKDLASIGHPALGIDLDGCVDEAPVFFNVLTHVWPGKVFVVTFRRDREKAVAYLGRFCVRYDELILVNSFDAKAKAVQEKGILVYFDDQPEMLKNVSPLVNVMLVRNGGNFDFNDRRWMFSDQTAKLL